MKLAKLLEDSEQIITKSNNKTLVEEVLNFHFGLENGVDEFYLTEEDEKLYIYIIEQNKFWFLALAQDEEIIVETYKLENLERISQKQKVVIDEKEIIIGSWLVQLKFRNEEWINLFVEKQSKEIEKQERFKKFYKKLKNYV
ncbi:hypothetical protein MWH28_11870 [Natroniella sulfidigena]|uniref:hypothetical protein n=1 Tax=Natroniella sulfidigena TaxID=723921 RepID=UPI00200A48FC|nr:hypothetical protein [Natroniella sulfidigena]MCK8818055.1 hypothetical protein [Natroniella sulfidigena]